MFPVFMTTIYTQAMRLRFVFTTAAYWQMAPWYWLLVTFFVSITKLEIWKQFKRVAKSIEWKIKLRIWLSGLPTWRDFQKKSLIVLIVKSRHHCFSRALDFGVVKNYDNSSVQALNRYRFPFHNFGFGWNWWHSTRYTIANDLPEA